MNYMHPMGFAAHPISPVFASILVVLVIWSLIWKGFALWHAARNHQKAWFIIMLIVNSLGILEIVYLAFFRKDRNTLSTTTPATEPPSAPGAV